MYPSDQLLDSLPVTAPPRAVTLAIHWTPVLTRRDPPTHRSARWPVSRVRVNGGARHAEMLPTSRRRDGVTVRTSSRDPNSLPVRRLTPSDRSGTLLPRTHV